MLESGLSGSVRGVPSNGHLYRDPRSVGDTKPCPRRGQLSSKAVAGCRRRLHRQPLSTALAIDGGTYPNCGRWGRRPRHLQRATSGLLRRNMWGPHASSKPKFFRCSKSARVAPQNAHVLRARLKLADRAWLVLSCIDPRFPELTLNYMKSEGDVRKIQSMRYCPRFHWCCRAGVPGLAQAFLASRRR